MINVARRYATKKKNSSKKFLNMAIIGCGGAGLMHTSHYLWHKHSMVKYIYDIDRKNSLLIENENSQNVIFLVFYKDVKHYDILSIL